MLTVFGASVVTFMMLMYAVERRHGGFVLAFACGCALSSAYGFLAGTWPFGVVEAIWAIVAVHRFVDRATKPSYGRIRAGRAAVGQSSGMFPESLQRAALTRRRAASRA